MNNMFSKSGLAIFLSKLSAFTNHNLRLEQYETPSEIAADFLWQIHICDQNIVGKDMVDLGSGTGILGIGALLLGAKQVTFVEIDEDVIELLKKNLQYAQQESGMTFSYQIVNADVSSGIPCGIQTEICICNPPFGTKNKHVDRDFLCVAIKIARFVYSFHKSNTIDYLLEYFSSRGFKTAAMKDYSFGLHQSQKFHEKEMHRIEVSSIRIEKK